MRSQIQQKMAAKPTLEELLESDCDVCFVSFNRVTPKRVEEGLQILFCSRCYIHVHKCCYDFQPSLTVLSQRVSEFLCDRCRSETPQEQKCLICQGTQGAMKKIGEKDYIHVYCGLMHNDIEVVSYYPSITFKRSVYYEENNYNCEICHLKNAHQHCAEDTCKRKVHVYCAKKHYYTLSKEVEEPKSWNHRMSVGNHGNFDLSDQIIPYELLSEEVQTSLHQFQEIGFELPFKQDLKRKIHRQYLQETRSRRKSTKKLRRGGFSYVVCPQHQSISYCLCYGKADGQQMVLCECCFEWYHHKCVKYTTTEDSYICAFCRSFYQFKRKAVEEVKGGRTQYDVSKLQLPLKISVMDVIWVLRVLDNRIRGGLAGKMLKQLYKYPLKSSCMDLLIRHQNRNKLSALADDCLLRFSTSEQVEALLRPRRVLATDAQGRPYVLTESVDYNRLIRKGIEVLVGMGMRGQGFAAILKELEFKERALSDSYEQIIELSKVEQNYQEVQILRQKAQAYNFIEIIKKINEKTPVSITELQDSIQKAQSVASLPHYLAQTLRDKYEAVSPLIQRIGKEIRESPENGYLITQLVQQLQGMDVLPPLEYHQLTMQRKFVQNMYLYMVKQEGNKIEEEMTVQQKIDMLLAFNTLKPNQELIDIISTYKPNSPTPIWKNIDQLITKYQNIAIEFQIKEIIKRRYCKQEKFAAIIERVKEYKCVSAVEEVRAVVEGWKDIQGMFQKSIGASLQGLADYEDICEHLKTVNSVIEAIQNFAVKIQEENQGKSFVGLAKSRKEELEQLKVLYTESQLQKNPLTLAKLLPSLPKTNPLVKQWHSLKKQQSNFHNKFTTILARVSERLQFFKNEKKLQRKQQIKQNCDKPSISQITEFIDMLKHSNVDMSKQMRELTRYVNNSLEIAGKVKKYIEEKGDCSLSNLEELSNRRKEIQEQRRKVLTIAELNLKSELIQLYHLQICNRMRTSLISPGLDLQKISTLLKFAEEENLTHAETYIALKDKFQTKNQKSKEVNLIKNLEQSLAAEASKDLSPNFTHLFVYRKGLSIPEISQPKTKNIYMDDMIEKNKQIREKISNALQQRPGKWELNQARLLYLQALKNPYFQPELNRMSVEVTKACDLLRRWKEIGRSFNHLHPIFLDYQILTFTIQEIESVKREIKNNEDQIGRLHLFVSSFNQANRDQLQEIIQRIQNTNVIKETEICKQAELKYLNYWIKFLQYSKSNKKTVPYEKIRRLTIDSYNLLQKNLRLGEDYDELKTIIYQLQDYLILVKNHLKSYPTYSVKTCIADSFIDLEEFYLQNDDQEQQIADFVTILRPFSDLSKFRVKNLQRLQLRREELTSKRSRDKFQDLRGQSDKHIPKQFQPPSSQSLPQVVSQTQRKKIKQIFLKNIRKNPELKKYGQCQNQVKMIENQIFGEWHNDIIKYFQMSQEFQKLFIKLINCPNISNKIIKKKFQFKFIQILVSNLAKIDELEGMIVSKIKEIETEKTISKISETINEKNIQLERENEAVIESIASGKVDQSLKQDLKKEMKLLKEGKQKKKSKHHKHRSRSRSPDAKFSEESEKELPVYIREEYNQDQTKVNDKKTETNMQKMTDSPLRYDPQEDDMQSREVVFPRGSILKLKNCDLQISTKKKGKIEFPVQILTEQEHKKILAELFDPGFSRLSIKKDKNESEIIQYISKSKKKYKYLITWFQALKPQDNEILKDIANDANEKKKIFGWQNQHIKIHIMSVKQLVQINRFNIPARVTSPSAANQLNNQRVIMIVQYPQKVYEVREHYKQYAEIERKSQEYNVFVPPAVVEAPIYDFYPKYTMPTIQPLAKPVYEEPKMIYQGGWGDSGATSIPPPIPQPLPPQIVNVPIQNAPPASNLPYKVNQIRLHFGLNSFSPILTDQDDVQQQKNNGDLASDLLNSLGDFGKMPPQQPPPSIPREKPQPQSQHQQQYQGYYGGYNYQPPARTAPPADNRWSGYPSMNQPMSQPMPTQSQVYNPLNPMAGKYSNPPPMNPLPNQMYKNPIMGQPQPRPPNLGGQYYRPPSGQGYDPRYQGGYQQ